MNTDMTSTQEREFKRVLSAFLFCVAIAFFGGLALGFVAGVTYEVHHQKSHNLESHAKQ